MQDAFAYVGLAIAGEERSDALAIVVKSAAKPPVETSEVTPEIAFYRRGADKIIAALTEKCDFVYCRYKVIPQETEGLCCLGYAIVFQPKGDLRDPDQAVAMAKEIEARIETHDCKVLVARTLVDLYGLVYDPSEMAALAGWGDDALVAYDKATFGRKLSKSGERLAKVKQQLERDEMRPIPIGRDQTLCVGLIDKREYQSRLAALTVKDPCSEQPEQNAQDPLDPAPSTDPDQPTSAAEMSKTCLGEEARTDRVMPFDWMGNTRLDTKSEADADTWVLGVDLAPWVQSHVLQAAGSRGMRRQSAWCPCPRELKRARSKRAKQGPHARHIRFMLMRRVHEVQSPKVSCCGNMICQLRCWLTGAPAILEPPCSHTHRSLVAGRLPKERGLPARPPP
ncbi:hypothetical protein QQG91_08880 [Marivivens sp. LCG002]|uniref:hypothetical protein n=1 Tax=Marivivens sp. LCG002 TaxID=3051171 RepID=UPI0025577B75|nr:hypothetical protein [Marivivens sp. LCG002]WIV49787.1 hypothetical protein QQG91_08880 [Marivivens sp. LCG002]